jgi:ABC-type branched-subunit amino acid transport system substrate-binding protein
MFTQVLKHQVMALLDDYSSDPSQAAALICRYFNIPQISYGASALTFDDKTLYPNFFRGLPNAVAQASSLAYLIYNLGYRRCGVIGTNAIFDQTGAAAFQVEQL